MRKAFLAFVLLCVGSSAAAPAGAIVGGQPDGNRHPQVGALVDFIPQAGRTIAYCSGTLISPTVFLTAAHCAVPSSPTTTVTFAEQYSPSAPTHRGRIFAHPEFNPSANTAVNDVAVVVFDKPVKGITPARLPTAGLLDQMGLTQSSSFTAVGYGDTEFVNGPGGKSTNHVQARHYAVGTFHSLTPRALHLSQNASTGDGGTCNGDSGGPNFIGAGSAETTIIAGTTVTGDTYCTSTNVDQRVDIPSVRAFLDDFVALP
jgi:secreted trypsin-like serine protease